MKNLNKFVLFVLALLFITYNTVFAGVLEPLNVEINSSTWTEVALPSSTTLKGYAFQTRDGTDFYWKRTSGSTNYFTVRDGLTVYVELSERQTQSTLFYAKSASGTPTVEVFLLNWR